MPLMPRDYSTHYFFFHRSGNHRDLHSFPTRRSSDLAPPQHERTAPEPINRAESQQRKDQIRSEEHTSELQSRVDLVCRLLLEKKKKTHRTSLAQYKPRIASGNHRSQTTTADPTRIKD